MGCSNFTTTAQLGEIKASLGYVSRQETRTEAQRLEDAKHQYDKYMFSLIKDADALYGSIEQQKAAGVQSDWLTAAMGLAVISVGVSHAVGQLIDSLLDLVDGAMK